MSRLRVFISSRQDELEPERLMLYQLLTTDPLLKLHLDPVLFEKLPPPSRPGEHPYLDVLRGCQIYILMIDREFAPSRVQKSATMREYELALEMKLPSLTVIKGDSRTSRDPRTLRFIERIKTDGFTYRNFIDRIDLREIVDQWLRQVLKDEFHLQCSEEEEESCGQSVSAASVFELEQQDGFSLGDLHPEASAELTEAITGEPVESGSPLESLAPLLRNRGLLWRDAGTGSYIPTAAGVIVLGGRPSLKYIHCEILADVYDSINVSLPPLAQARFSAPAVLMIKQCLAFIDRYTAHPTRVVGINNIRLDEYPVRALREVLVNAVAHRDYYDTSRKIRLEIFSDRIVISSPGYLPKPLTVSKLRRGTYGSCRRNPIIAECLAAHNLMEQRGTGYERIKIAMRDHGLDEQTVAERDGYFMVTLHGPAGSYDRIRTPVDAALLVPPSLESRLNDRQKRIITRVMSIGSITSGWCTSEFGVSYSTAYLDLTGLVELGLLSRVGKGRSTRYEAGEGRG